MHNFISKSAICVALLATASNAFVAPSSGGIMSHRTVAFSTSGRQGISANTNSESRQSRMSVFSSPQDTDDKDDEIARLRSMAAQLRAEAASLEAEKAQALADAAEKAFERFDTNKDGEVSLAELKAGLEKKLKTELSETRVEELLKAFDTSGDGALQLDEFVGIDQFRNKLEALARDEKEVARQAAKQAKVEAEEALLAEARLAILNEKPPSNADKLLSVLPYLFPLLDGLQFGRFLLEGDTSNPFVVGLALLYTLYRSIPFGGFIAFFALNFLGSNPSLNRLIRFNMQQAIFLDIALFFPSLIFTVYSLLEKALGGGDIPPQVTELGTDAVFISFVAVLGYAVVSSLLGITPDKIPFVSGFVSDRMPTIDMFDDQGRFIGRPREDPKDKDEKKDD